jgi:hypothetical protein
MIRRPHEGTAEVATSATVRTKSVLCPPKFNRQRRPAQLVLAIVFLFGACGCDTAKESGSESSQEIESRAKEYNFGAKHNAVVDWLDSKSKVEGFTLAFQNALIRQDGRPILENVLLEDVRRDAEGLMAQFASSWALLSECRWQLSCTPEQAHALMEGGRYESYLIIVSVSSVKNTGVEHKTVTLVRGQLIDYQKE